MEQHRLDSTRLRPRCAAEAFDFATTADVEPVENIVGQDRAVAALEFGLRTNAPGHNIFVRGLSGSGRLALVEELLARVLPFCALTRDRCYVRNFDEPDRPKLITLPAGRAPEFRRRVDELIDFVRDGLSAAMSSEKVRSRRAEMQARFEQELAAVTEPFDAELREQNLVVINVQAAPGQAPQLMMVPIIDGQPVPPDRFDALRKAGEIDDDTAQRIVENVRAHAGRYEEVVTKLALIQQRQRDAQRDFVEAELRAVLGHAVATLRRDFPGDDVGAFVDGLIGDLVHRVSRPAPDGADFSHLYRVNVLLSRATNRSCPIVVENSPTLRNLLGSVERSWSDRDGPVADHMAISAGSLVRADGGYLILDVREVLSELGAWKVLMRTLRSGQLEIVPSDLASPWTQIRLKPIPVDVAVKVILIGDDGMFSALDAQDPDFPNLFKVLADFERTIQRDEAGAMRYAGVLARIARDEQLPAFDREAVAQLVEHGARIAARQDRLTARFGRLADIAREAAFLAHEAGRDTTIGDDVRDAIRRGKQRADMPARRYRELIREGVLRVETGGAVIGQINGLAVAQAGPLSYGFPSRITASIGPGTEGVINVEREARLSGAIHTKGTHILAGLLRRLLPTRHPLSFRASIAFEQSYGGIDGDSASGAEACCLLSALTEHPIHQAIAMTGAIDQLGHLQPVGAVTEKIEGFFDVCNAVGLSGEQGVIIPRANVVDLMLREDVVEACAADRFHVWAVDEIRDALSILTADERPIGELGEDHAYPMGTLFADAMERANAYWRDSNA